MREFLTLYRAVLRLNMRYRKQYLISWVFVLLLLILNNVSVFAIGYIIDNIQKEPGVAFQSIGLMALAILIPLFIEPIAFYNKSRVFAKVVGDLVATAYEKIINLDYNFHTNKQTGRLISMVIGAQDSISLFTWVLEWGIIEHFAGLIVPLFLIALIRLDIAIIILLVVLLSIPVIKVAINDNQNRRISLKRREYLSNSLIIDGISNFETVRIFGREEEESLYLGEALEQRVHAMNRYQNSFRTLDALTRVIGLTIFLCGGTLGIIYYQAEIITTGGLIVILTYLLQIAGKFSSLVWSSREVLKNYPVAIDLFDLLQQENSIPEPENPTAVLNPEGAVHFKSVSFSYNSNGQTVSDLSLEVQPRKSIALVGPSGGGKSTLMRLLMRYYDPQEGSIEIDGVNLKQIASKQLRSLVGLVPQEPVLFNRTLAYNVGYALSSNPEIIEASMDKIQDACRKAQIHDFITSLPDGYETQVGERGIKLSGGQKQRIAIARVLLKTPKIIIFDEATSMLDSESEMAIQKAFHELSRDKTTIIIAHRLSTIIGCDSIFVIDKGMVVESGKHHELLKNGGLYANLWKIQSGGFRRSDL